MNNRYLDACFKCTRERHAEKNIEEVSEYENSCLSYGEVVLMDHEKGLSYINGWNHYTMKFVGLWPEERKWNKPSNYLALIPILMMLCFVCVPQTVNLLLVWGDLYLVIENLSLGNITISISVLKAIAFWIHGKPLKSLLKNMTDDWKDVTDDKDRETMSSVAEYTRNLIKRRTLMCLGVVYAYVTLRILTAKYTGSKLLFRAYFPYNVDVSPNYELTVIAQLIATVCAAACYTAVDTFISMLILHICGQLMNLRDKVQRIGEYDQKDLHTKLVKIVRKHQYINRFAETIERCSNMMLLIQMLGSTVQLCFQSIQALMPFDAASKELVVFQDLFLAVYIVFVLVQLYLYCYVGQKLSGESIEIANAAYNSKWYNLTPKNARLLVIIMCRARLPLGITAGKFCLFSIMLYSQVLRTSLGYISVLYAMKE